MTTVTPDEIGRLLALAAARDQRTVGDADTLAWYSDLNAAGVTFDDAAAAITRYYAVEWPRQAPADRFRITAPVVIELTLKARAARLEGFVFARSRDYREVSGAEYVRILRSQLADAGDGRRPALPAGEIDGNPATAAQVQQLVAGAAAKRALPENITDALSQRRHPARQIECPWDNCRAKPGTGCVLVDGKARRELHPSRLEAWAVFTAACPTCRTAAGEPCRVAGTTQPYPHGAHRERLTAAQEAA